MKKQKSSAVNVTIPLRATVAQISAWDAKSKKENMHLRQWILTKLTQAAGEEYQGESEGGGRDGGGDKQRGGRGATRWGTKGHAGTMGVLMGGAAIRPIGERTGGCGVGTGYAEDEPETPRRPNVGVPRG